MYLQIDKNTNIVLSMSIESVLPYSPPNPSFYEITISDTEATSFNPSIDQVRYVYDIQAHTFTNIGIRYESNNFTERLENNLEILTKRYYFYNNTSYPVFKKLFLVSSLPNASSMNINHNISNIQLDNNYYININGIMGDNSKNFYPISAKLKINNSTITIDTTDDLSSYKAIITIEYTKINEFLI